MSRINYINQSGIEKALFDESLCPSCGTVAAWKWPGEIGRMCWCTFVGEFIDELENSEKKDV